MYSIPDRELDPPYLSHGVEIIAPADWDAPLVRCAACGLVEFAGGRRAWDDACGCPRYMHTDDIDPVCAECESECVTPIPGRCACQRCFSAAAAEGDDYCHSCGIAEALDDEIMMRRMDRSVQAAMADLRRSTTDDCVRFIREITLAQGGA